MHTIFPDHTAKIYYTFCIASDSNQKLGIRVYWLAKVIIEITVAMKATPVETTGKYLLKLYTKLLFKTEMVSSRSNRIRGIFLIAIAVGNNNLIISVSLKVNAPSHVCIIHVVFPAECKDNDQD